jgi:hypothetical protein
MMMKVRGETYGVKSFCGVIDREDSQGEDQIFFRDDTDLIFGAECKISGEDERNPNGLWGEAEIRRGREEEELTYRLAGLIEELQMCMSMVCVANSMKIEPSKRVWTREVRRDRERERPFGQCIFEEQQGFDSTTRERRSRRQ